MTPEISPEDRNNCFEKNNDIRFVLLGLLKCLDELEQQTHEAASWNDSYPTDERLVLALLGVLSVRRKLHQWVQWCTSETHVNEEERTCSNTVKKSLLR